MQFKYQNQYFNIAYNIQDFTLVIFAKTYRNYACFEVSNSIKKNSVNNC